MEFELTQEQLKYYDADLNHVVDPGEIEVMIGSSSDDKDLQRATIYVQ